MANRRKKFPGFGLLLAAVLVVCVGAAAVAFYMTSGSGNAVAPRVAARSKVKPAVVVQVGERRKVVVFLPAGEANRVYLAPTTVKTEAKGGALDIAVRALLEAGEEGGRAAGLIPDGTRLRRPVSVDGDTVTVDLTREFVDNFSGGSDQEALTLNAIVHTVVRNSGGEVRKARILVEGETAESLGGHFDLTEPVEADSTLLKPGSED